MPISVPVDVEVELSDFCDVGDLKKVIGYAMLSPDSKIEEAAINLNKELLLQITIGDEYCPEPKCDRSYRLWLAERTEGSSPQA